MKTNFLKATVRATSAVVLQIMKPTKLNKNGCRIFNSTVLALTLALSCLSARGADAAQIVVSTTIQAAVNQANPGDTVFIGAGVYNEQVVVMTSNLTILGSGIDSTVLRPTGVKVNSTGVDIPFPVSAILLIDGANGVSVKNLTIDGHLADDGAANLSCRDVGFYMGVYYRNSSGIVESIKVINIRSATVCSAGLSGSTGSGLVSNLVLKGSLFENYGSVGMRCSGGAVCSVIGNTFRGRGPVSDQVQGGIIFRGGAGGEIFRNIITNHFYIPAVGISEFSAGIVLFNAPPNLNPHLLQNNSFFGNQINIQRSGTAQTIP